MVDINANANEAGKNSSQAVANQSNNSIFVKCCSQRTAVLLIFTIFIIAVLGFGLGFGLSSESNNDVQ